MERREAIAQGLTKYATGRPCCRGHVGDRWAKSGMCVECFAPVARANAARYRSENAEKCQESARLRHQRAMANGESVAQVRARTKKASAQYRATNLQAVLTAQRQRYSENLESERSRSRGWRASNEAAARARDQRARCRRKGAEGSHTASDITSLLSEQEGMCAACEADLSKVKWHVDHKRALARGGTNWPENLQILCAPCNLAKGVSDDLEFKARRLGFRAEPIASSSLSSS